MEIIEETLPNITECQSSSSSSADEEVHEIMVIESAKHERALKTNSSGNRSSIPRKSNHSPQQKKRTKHRATYLSSWENDPASFYLSYYYDNLGIQHSRYILWLCKKTDKENNKISLGCLLCEKHGMLRNKNGTVNAWATKGSDTLALDKIKEHRSNKTHQEAEKMEIEKTRNNQPDWISTRKNVLSKQQESIHNLMYSSIYICQNDQSLNSFSSLCILLEKIGVKLLPAEVSSVSYRNDCAALTFLQHIASVLHIDLVNKLKKSPILGWMMDESTSRSTEKSCIVYVRYLDDFVPQTSFYGILNMEGDGSAENIVQKLIELWEKDDLPLAKTCWLATDNASTFKGVHDGVAAKLRKSHGMPCLELNTCVAHRYALVGKHSGQHLDDDGKIKPRPFIASFEGTIGKIYNYFHRSANRQFKLKQWYDYLSMPEMKFKRLFEIRWLSIRDCLKPLMANMKPGNQALLASLECTAHDGKVTQNERDAAANLLNEILDDRFLFILHFHFDIHECISGELTKLMQNNDISYKTLMDTIADKKQILNSWVKKEPNGTCPWGPSLAEYINSHSTGESFGAFKILPSTTRDGLSAECSLHVRRLLEEIDRRFPTSELHQFLSNLFDPSMLRDNQSHLNDATFGRKELEYLCRKYEKLLNFDVPQVRIEWESFKPLLVNFMESQSTGVSSITFWQNFIQLKKTTSEQFLERFKNILLLLSVYLISPLNSAECERGFSAANRIQTTSRARIMIETLDCLLTVRLLLSDDIRSARCEEIVEKAFLSWNDPESNRRLNRVKLLIDVPDDYQPCRQTRSTANKRERADNAEVDPVNSPKRTKKKKSQDVKCANRCGRIVSSDDPMQANAIMCCHQNEYYSWIDEDESCRRWLCNFCRIKLAISTDTHNWFCDDHHHIHD